MGHLCEREIHPPCDQISPTQRNGFSDCCFYLPSPLCSDFDGC
jgi:hypothetical protein